MNISVVQLDPFQVVMMRHSGPYDQIEPAFARLWQWVEAESVPVFRSLGLYWDNPDHVPANELRSAAAVEVSSAAQLRLAAGLEQFTIPGGSYATTRWVGRYDELAPLWSRFSVQAEKKSRGGIPEAPAFEVYVNDPEDTPPDELITELYMPLG